MADQLQRHLKGEWSQVAWQPDEELRGRCKSSCIRHRDECYVPEALLLPPVQALQVM